MKFDVLTLFPELIQTHMYFSIMKRASEDGIISVNTINPRDYTLDKHKCVDSPPYGGGAGMVLTPQPYVDAYESIIQNPKEKNLTLMMTPQGEPFTDKLSNEFAEYDRIIILCGHYEGFDERIRLGLKPREISIGDFVLTGGELGALILIDSISRNLENYLGKDKCAHDDSFSVGLNGLLEYPHYTKPREYQGMKVPEVLLNGNHKEIEEFRKQESIKRTKIRRPDLLN